MNCYPLVHHQNDCLMIYSGTFNWCKYPSRVILCKIRYKHKKKPTGCLLHGWITFILNSYVLFKNKIVWLLHRKLCERNTLEYKVQASLSARNSLSHFKKKRTCNRTSEMPKKCDSYTSLYLLTFKIRLN